MHARRTRAADPPQAIHAEPPAATGLAARAGSAALWLQRTAGNHAAAGVLTRAPEAHVKQPPKNAPGPGETQAKKLAGRRRVGSRLRARARGHRDGVTATEPTRLLVLDWELVNWLMKAHPAFGERIEQVSRERLATL